MALAAGRRARVPRGAVVGAGVAAGLLVVALAGGRPGREGPPLDPRSDGALGTSALVSLLEGVGARVDLASGLPDPDADVALLLQDRLDGRQADALAGWIRAGGTLVVTDPSSAFAPEARGSGIGLPTGDLERGACTIDALASVEKLEVGSPVRYAAVGADQLCFADEDGAFVVAVAQGQGQVVAVGGAAFLTNDLLGEADNAVLATTLLAPGARTHIRFVDAPIPAGGGDKTLGDLVPGGVERALLQLAVAFVLYALWRAIRLGRPVAEDQPVAVAGSELVVAIGRLLSRTRAPGAAAEALRQSLRRSLRARLGVPGDAPPGLLAEMTAARTGLDVAEVLAAIDERPVTTDAELVAVARAAATIHQEVPS